jgi:hypothetical protein
MAGLLPTTNYMLILDNVIVADGFASKYIMISSHFSLAMTDNDEVLFNGMKKPPSYCLSNPSVAGGEWPDKDSALKDWVKNHLTLPQGYHTRRYLV